MNGQTDRPEESAGEQPVADGVEEKPEQEEQPEQDSQPPEGDSPAKQKDDEQPTVEEVQAQADENWDRFVRKSAELENVRKRAARDVENARKFGLERFAKELLAVKDSLEMGLATENPAVENLLEGSTATLKLLGNTMQQFGIEEVNPEGEPFDPDRHEAISMQPSDNVEPGSVVSVVQKGYSLNGRLLRPAMVVVAAE